MIRGGVESFVTPVHGSGLSEVYRSLFWMLVFCYLLNSNLSIVGDGSGPISLYF